MFAYLPDVARTRPAARRTRAQALAAGGPPADHDPDARPGRPRPRVHAAPSSRSPSPAGGFRSTRSTSPTCSRPRTRPSACSRSTSSAARAARSSPTPTEAPLRALLLGAAPPRVRGDDGLRRSPRRSSTRRSPSCARRSVRGARRPRRRSATGRASCTRPASSTRAARGSGASCSCCTTARRTCAIPGAPYTFTTLKHAQAIGDLQHAARARAAGRARAPGGRGPGGARCAP